MGCGGGSAGAGWGWRRCAFLWGRRLGGLGVGLGGWFLRRRVGGWRRCAFLWGRRLGSWLGMGWGVGFCGGGLGLAALRVPVGSAAGGLAGIGLGGVGVVWAVGGWGWWGWAFFVGLGVGGWVGVGLGGVGGDLGGGCVLVGAVAGGLGLGEEERGWFLRGRLGGWVGVRGSEGRFGRGLAGVGGAVRSWGAAGVGGVGRSCGSAAVGDGWDWVRGEWG